jgi:hypothetical protein
VTLTSRHAVAGFAILLVVAGVAGGLLILGPPGEERINRFDQRRVEDLQRIEEAVNVYRTRHGRLPTSLEELSREAGIGINARDPGTMEAYEYRPLDERTFEVCAAFERESGQSSAAFAAGFWSHGSGRQCFRLLVRELRAY